MPALDWLGVMQMFELTDAQNFLLPHFTDRLLGFRV